MKTRPTKNMYKAILWGMGVFMCVFTACEDFVEIPEPITELGPSAVFNNDAGAHAAISGVYIKIMDNFGYFANTNTTLYGGLSSDEFQNHRSDSDQIAIYENNLSPSNVGSTGLWNDAHTTIYRVNAILEGLERSEAISPETYNQVRGEALFMRAFSHFYLTNFFGEIPYITETDYTQNSKVVRLPVTDVYDLIISDLQEAQKLLADGYPFSSGERIRPNRYAATALLARAYLYRDDWDNAVRMATEVIDQKASYSLTALNEVFKANSQEAIWQLQPVITGANTIEGYSFGCCVSTNISLTPNLVDAFDVSDQRWVSWVNQTTIGDQQYHYPFKYQVVYGTELTEYYMVLRLAEQYLIRAEARAQLNNISGAVADLNTIRTRAELADYSGGNDKNEVLQAIYKERQLELFAEWGHRWFDLKRTGNISVLSYKQGWGPTDALYPIPESEISLNPHLTQNPGY